ncbi:MAG TPA: hypothetical protein VIY86_09480 [Pirellulaceae bacterium]
MLILTAGLLLLLGGIADRFPLVGHRTNAWIAGIGAVVSAWGVTSSQRGKRDDVKQFVDLEALCPPPNSRDSVG